MALLDWLKKQAKKSASSSKGQSNKKTTSSKKSSGTSASKKTSSSSKKSSSSSSAAKRAAKRAEEQRKKEEEARRKAEEEARRKAEEQRKKKEAAKKTQDNLLKNAKATQEKQKKRGSAVISNKTASKKQAAKKAQDNLKDALERTKKVEKKTSLVDEAKKAQKKSQKKSALGTEIKRKTETVKVDKEEGKKTKGHAKVRVHTYEEMTAEDYNKLAVATQQGRLDEMLKSDKKLAKKVADLNVKDYIKSPAVMGALDQLTMGRSVSDNPVYNYSDTEKAITGQQKQTGAYNVGRAVGAIGEFALGGTGTLGAAFGEGVLKTAGKEALKGVAKQGGKQVAKHTAKNVGKEALADTIVSAPLNILDAVKFSYKDGKIDKNEFWKEVKFNTAGDLLLGGIVSGVAHGFTAKQMSDFNAISNKLKKGESVSEKDMRTYVRQLNELTNKVEPKLKQLETTEEIEARRRTEVEQPRVEAETPTVRTEEPTVSKTESVEQPKVEETVDGGVDDVVQPKVDVENRSYELHENKSLKSKGGDYKPRGKLNGWSYAINRRYNGDVSITWWKGQEKHQSVFEPYTTNAEALYDFTDFLAKKELDVKDIEIKGTPKAEEPTVRTEVEQPTVRTEEPTAEAPTQTADDLARQVDEMRRGGATDDEILEQLEAQGVEPYRAMEAVDGGIEDVEWKAVSEEAYNNPPKTYDNAAEMVEDQAKKPTASDVRAVFERQKKGSFEVSENDMRFAKTLWKSEECTDDALRAELKDMRDSGLFGKKHEISNAEALEIGRQRVQSDAKGQTDTFVNNVNEGKKLTKQDFATATELLIHYKNTGDVANWKKVALAMAQGYSDAGRVLQSARMVRRLTPEGRAAQILKLAERIKQDFAKTRGKNIDINVSDETLERILKAKNEKELNKAFKDARVEIYNQVPTTAMEKLQAAQRMAMLGNPKTMLRNVLGNCIFKPIRSISGTIELGLQKAGTKQLAKLDSGRTKKMVKPEDREMYRGFRDEAEKIFDDIYDQFGGSNAYAEEYGRPHEANIFTNRSKKVSSAISSKIQGSNRISKAFKSAADYVGKNGALQSVHNIIMGGLEKGDIVILKPEFKRSFAQFCYARNLNPSTMTKEQLEEAIEHSMNEAKYATFRNDSALASMIARKQGEWMTKKGATSLQTLAYRAGAGFIQTMLPFKKTPINIAKVGLDYSPLGVVRGVVHNIEAIKRTGDPDLLLKSYKEMASGLTGTAIMGLGYALYSTGNVTVKAGNWSTDEWYDKEMGNQDYSIKIGDYTFSMSWCAPLNMPFLMGAALGQEIEEKGFSIEAGLNMLNGMADSFFELSFAQSLKEFVTENETIEDYLLDFSVMPLQYFSQLIPTVSSQFATVMDDWQRDTTSYADGSLSRAWWKEINKNINKIPVLREKFLEPKVDRFGKKIPSSAGETILAKSMITFFSTANVKEITMTDDDRYIIDVLQETSDEETREKLLPESGSFFAGRTDGKDASPEDRTKYQISRGKEYQKLVQSQRTAKYQDVLSLDQKQEKLITAKWSAVMLADAKTYGYKYALKANDERSKGSDNPTKTMSDFNVYKGTNPDKTAKDYFNALYSIKTTQMHAGDGEWATKALALYKINADDATFVHFKVDIGKREVFENYLGEYKGSEDEYYHATNSIQRNADEKNGGYLNNVIKTMTLASMGAKDRVYYAIGVLGENHETMNLGRGLVAEGFTIDEIMAHKQYAASYNEDGKGNLKKDEVVRYIESLGLKTTKEKALLFAALSTANNPYGDIGSYAVDGDVLGGATASSSGGSGYRRSSGSSKTSETTAKKTKMPSWENYVKDYVSSAEKVTGVKFKEWDSPLDKTYQNKINSILEDMEV